MLTLCRRGRGIVVRVAWYLFALLLSGQGPATATDDWSSGGGLGQIVGVMAGAHEPLNFHAREPSLPLMLVSVGSVWVLDPDAGFASGGKLFRVDAVTGARTVVSDFNSGLNPDANPTGIAVESTGSILVLDPNAGFASGGKLFRVDAVTGARTVVSDFNSGLNPGANPTGLAIRLIREEVFADGFEAD